MLRWAIEYILALAILIGLFLIVMEGFEREDQRLEQWDRANRIQRSR